jgi:phosphotriesterase-related protein
MESRREFIKRSSTIVASCIPLFSSASSKEKDIVMTVKGPVASSDLKFTLSHEHILVDFIGADQVSKRRYCGDEVFKKALPILKQVQALGCSTFGDCTPMYLGRDAQLLQRLSIATSLNIICATGYYGARQEKFFPKHAYTESAEQIAARWISEWKNGIDGTTIKPGLIKSGVDHAPLSETQRKVIEATALTHLATGLTIGIHTGNGAAAQEELEILTSNGVAPQAFIWIHAQNETDTNLHVALAQRGSWISFDGVGKQSLDKNVELLKNMKAAELLRSVLVSHDSGWYHVGEPEGGSFNNYNTIVTDFIPLLRQNGFSQDEIDLIFITNPAKAFSVKIRKL